MIISAFLYLHFHLRPLPMEMSPFHDAIVWAKPRTANPLHFLTYIILTWKSCLPFFIQFFFRQPNSALSIYLKSKFWIVEARRRNFFFLLPPVLLLRPEVVIIGNGAPSVFLLWQPSIYIMLIREKRERKRGAKSFKYLQLQFLRSSCFDKCDFSRERGESSPSGRFSTVKGAVPTRPALK